MGVAYVLVITIATVSVAVATLFGPISVAVTALVLLALVLARLVGTPIGLVSVSGAVLLGAAWASVFDLYARIDWLDVVVHAVATGSLAAMCTGALLRAGIVTVGVGPRKPALVCVATALAVGLALGVLWELGEWFGHTYLDDRIAVGYDDTIGDLVAGGFGAAIAGALLSRGHRSAPTSTLRSRG